MPYSLFYNIDQDYLKSSICEINANFKKLFSKMGLGTKQWKYRVTQVFLKQIWFLYFSCRCCYLRKSTLFDLSYSFSNFLYNYSCCTIEVERITFSVVQDNIKMMPEI